MEQTIKALAPGLLKELLPELKLAYILAPKLTGLPRRKAMLIWHFYLAYRYRVSSASILHKNLRSASI